MPIIRVEMWEGRSVDQKRRIARELTDALVRIIDCDPATVRVLISDYSSENWAVGHSPRGRPDLTHQNPGLTPRLGPENHAGRDAGQRVWQAVLRPSWLSPIDDGP